MRLPFPQRLRASPLARGVLVASALLLPACSTARHGGGDPSRLGSLPARLRLLAVDRAAADSAGRHGVGRALAAIIDDRAVVLLPGAPVVAGAVDVRRALAGVASRATWVPLHAELSADSTLGTTHGVLLRTVGGAPAHGKYLAVWRRSGDAWRLLAWVVTGGVAPIADAQAPAAVPQFAQDAQDAATRAIADADRAFSAHAERTDASAAFAAFAAPDGTLFPATGDIARGPADIAARLRDVSRVTRWRWQPVVAVAAVSGDLGFTVGEAVIAPRDGSAAATAYSKYLTVWRRQPDGRWRFVADAGNARPAPR